MRVCFKRDSLSYQTTRGSLLQLVCFGLNVYFLSVVRFRKNEWLFDNKHTHGLYLSCDDDDLEQLQPQLERLATLGVIFITRTHKEVLQLPAKALLSRVSWGPKSRCGRRQPAVTVSVVVVFIAAVQGTIASSWRGETFERKTQIAPKYRFMVISLVQPTPCDSLVWATCHMAGTGPGSLSTKAHKNILFAIDWLSIQKNKTFHKICVVSEILQTQEVTHDWAFGF